MMRLLRASLAVATWMGLLALRAASAAAPATEPSTLATSPAGQTASPLVASDQTGSEATIAKLIEQLGSEDFPLREKAQSELAQLGLEAFDALHAAQNHHDPEIALRARYLVRSMSVRWFSESDPPEVVRLLKGYGDFSEGDRKNRMDRLAAMENHQGLASLCRLSRFETVDQLAKYGALKVLEMDPPQDATARAELSKTIRSIVGSSKRPASNWLRLYAQTLIEPVSVLADWDQATQTEHALLTKNPERTGPDIVRDLYRYQVELLKRLNRDEEAIAVIRRTFVLLDESADQVQELVDWLMQRKAWPVVLEVAGKFPAAFQDRAELLYCLAETHRQLGETDQAEQAAQKALALKPENLEEHLRTGSLLEERGLIHWAEREFREVLKTSQPGSVSDFQSRFRLSELLHDQLKELPAAEILKPVCDLFQKDEKAKETVLRASNNYRTPEGVMARANYFYACHYREQQDVAKEKHHLQKAIEADPEDADVLIAMYRLPAADEEWKAATRRRIEEAAANWLSQIEQLMMEADVAANEQTKAATEFVLSIECNQYAWLVGNTFGDYDKAVKLSHKSLELQPNDAGRLDTLARCYYAKGDLAKAVRYQSQAVKLNSYSGQIRRQLEFFVKEAKQRGVELPEELGL